MLMIGPEVKVYLCLGSTDMRRSVNGLSIMVSDVLEQDPFSGHLFGFCNRGRKIIKILYYDRNGFCIWYKRLEQERFRWPRNEGEVLELEGRELQWLLEGLSLDQPQAYVRENYRHVV